MKRFISWFASFFDETKPQSFSRLITFIMTAFVLGWDTQYVRLSHALPDAATMVGQVAFLTVFYGIRRGTGAYTDAKLGANQPEATNDGTGQKVGQ